MIPLPEFRFLPAPLTLVTLLHVVTLTLHLLAMNLLVGGLFFTAFVRRRGAEFSPTTDRLTRLLPTLLTATVTLGVAPLLFLQLVYHRQVYSASIVSAWFWLGIVAAVIGAYVFIYGAVLTTKRSPRYTLLPFAFVLAGYVSVVYSGVFAMAERPDVIAAAYAANASGTTFNPEPGSWVVRWIHMIAGAMAVGGLFVAWWGREEEALARRGRLFFLVSMGAALLAGFVYLITLGEMVLPIMRSRVIWELTASVLLALGATHFVLRRRFGWAAGLIGVSVLGMVSVRHAVRALHLADVFDPASIPVVSQWPVFVLFLMCLLVAILAIAFLIRSFDNRGSSAPGARQA
jgi:hypothetical protein